MRLLAFCFLLTAATQGALAQTTVRDLRELNGTWKLVRAQVDGMEVRPEFLAGHTFIFRRGKCSVVENGQADVVRMVVRSVKNPKWLDVESLVFPGKMCPGIYEIRGNQMKYCSRPAGGERPTEFSSKGANLLFLERVEEGKD